jgi:hypothetical protein
VIIVTASVVDPLSSTQQADAAGPKFVVPNLDSDAFDASARGKSQAGTSVPASSSQAQPPVQPASAGRQEAP